jgi:rhodanese-related sulfurtransferase
LECLIDSTVWRAASTEQDPLLIDVRNPGEFAQGHVPGAHNIPLEELRDRVHEWPRERELLLHCQVGHGLVRCCTQSTTAAVRTPVNATLTDAGF